jgi:hypothetical protein
MTTFVLSSSQVESFKLPSSCDCIAGSYDYAHSGYAHPNVAQKAPVYANAIVKSHGDSKPLPPVPVYVDETIGKK